jgi:hypothetical protein
MPIRFPDPPQQIAEAIEQRRPPTSRGPLRRMRERGGASEGAPVPAQPVFTVGLDDLLEGDGGGGAERSVTAPPTWRYSRFDVGGRAEVLELAERTGGGEVAAGDDRFGPLIREALAVADQDPRVREHDYEARLFRVPALNLLALWLHADSSLDLFVPVGRPAPGLDRNRIYQDEEFMSAVRSAAEQTRAAYDEADNPEELGS